MKVKNFLNESEKKDSQFVDEIEIDLTGSEEQRVQLLANLMAYAFDEGLVDSQDLALMANQVAVAVNPSESPLVGFGALVNELLHEGHKPEDLVGVIMEIATTEMTTEVLGDIHFND